MEREVGGGIGLGNTCKPMAVSFQCMTKFTTNKKKKSFFVIREAIIWKKSEISHWCGIFIKGNSPDDDVIKSSRRKMI